MKKILFPALSLAASVFAPDAISSTWVKIEIDKTGIYEISYRELAEMGFSSPTKVGIVGRGGVKMNIPSTGNQEIQKTPVIHTDGKLYFYADGTDSFSFLPDSSIPSNGRFINNGTNVYAPLGCYYLTDEPGMQLPMPTESQISETYSRHTEGVAFVCHESDLEHNSTNSGNLYWGERFNSGNPSLREWTLSLPADDPSREGVLECVFYHDRSSTGKLSYGTLADNTLTEYEFQGNDKSQTLNPSPLPLSNVSLSPGENSVRIEYNSDSNNFGAANLDYWLLTYPVKTTNLESCPAIRIAFPSIYIPRLMTIALPDVGSLKVIDISDPGNPSLLPVRKDESGRCFNIGDGKSVPQAIVFNTSLPQMKVSGWQTASVTPLSSRLRDMADNGADLLIIATPQLVAAANEIAEIHRQHDDTRTLIVTPEQIYAEYSSGLPDPEAYRHFISDLRNFPGLPLRNVLILGPVRSDARGINSGKEIMPHIMVQENEIHFERGAYMLGDFYGITSPVFNGKSAELATVDVGIGYLPFENTHEADTYIAKLRKYLFNSDFSLILNEMLFIGGTGDNHTHDKQAAALANHTASITSDGTVNTLVPVDAFGEKESHEKIASAVNAGKNVMLYIGHSGPSFLNGDPDIFSPADAHILSNSHLPFLITAGCSTTHTDMGFRGVSEHMAIGSERGAIGALCTTRETWAGQNFDFVKRFHTLFVDSESISEETGKPATIGEIYAKVQTMSRNVNDKAYILICDPALTIAAPQRKISLSLPESFSPEKNITVSGTVLDRSGNPDNSFSGNAVVKIATPEVTKYSDDFLSTSGKQPFTYKDNVITMAAANVKNGKFSVTLTFPSDRQYAAGDYLVYSSVFSPSTFTGGASGATVTLSSPLSAVKSSDKTPPVITGMEYDDESNTILVSASDNHSLNLAVNSYPSPVAANIDGVRIGNSVMLTGIADGSKEGQLTIALPPLTPGSHSAAIEISDLAGNRSSGEISFSVGQPETLHLEMVQKAATGEAAFAYDPSSNPMQLIIVDQSGVEMRRLDATGSSCVWDCRDAKGLPVSPGLYKAILIETANPSGIKRNSGSIRVPVL